MKKICSILLILSFLLAFTACDVSIKGEEGHMSEAFDLDEALEYISAIEPEVAEVTDEGLLAPARDPKTMLYGFINVKGEWVVKAKYPATAAFSGKYGLVLNSYSAYVYVNRKGKVVYDNYGKNPIAESNHFSEGRLLLSLSNDQKQKYVYVDEDFHTAVDSSKLPAVSGRWYYSNSLFGFATPFNNGLAVVMRQKNSDCKDGHGAETACIVNTSGKIVAKLPKGLDPDAAGVDNNGCVIVKNKSNLYGLCDSEGNQLIECKYRFLRHCEGSLYLACNDRGFWGYLDQNGVTAIPFQYQKALPFSEGLAAVYDGQYWGFIDETGELKIESVFDDVAALKSVNIDVSINKGAFCEGRAAVKKNGYWIIIDQNEYPYICFTADKCEGIEGCPFIGIANGYISYKNNVNGEILCGVMTVSGKRVIEPAFADIDIFN